MKSAKDKKAKDKRSAKKEIPEPSPKEAFPTIASVSEGPWLPETKSSVKVRSHRLSQVDLDSVTENDHSLPVADLGSAEALVLAQESKGGVDVQDWAFCKKNGKKKKLDFRGLSPAPGPKVGSHN